MLLQATFVNSHETQPKKPHIDIYKDHHTRQTLNTYEGSILIAQLLEIQNPQISPTNIGSHIYKSYHSSYKYVIQY